MKVKCINDYFDKELNRAVKSLEELEVTDARATILVNAKVCEALTSTPEVATEKPKKKTPAKKKSEATE